MKHTYFFCNMIKESQMIIFQIKITFLFMTFCHHVSFFFKRKLLIFQSPCLEYQNYLDRNLSIWNKSNWMFDKREISISIIEITIISFNPILTYLTFISFSFNEFRIRNHFILFLFLFWLNILYWTRWTNTFSFISSK